MRRQVVKFDRRLLTITFALFHRSPRVARRVPCMNASIVYHTLQGLCLETHEPRTRDQEDRGATAQDGSKVDDRI